MAFQEKRLTLFNGQQINYVEINPQGTKNILFVHGNFSSWIWWNEALQLIKSNKNYRVIAVDQRGFGKSSYIHPATRFNQHAQDLKNFIQLKGLKDAILIGWSYGGAVSMKTAQIVPELISKIILTASVSHLGLKFINQKGEELLTKQQIHSMPRLAFAEDLRKTRNFQAQRKIFDLMLFQKMPDYPQQKKKQLIQCSFVQAQYLDVLTALANPDINVQKIKAKTLMLHGRQDIVIKVDTVQQTGKLLGNSLQIWENHGHMLPIQDPIRFVQRISKFIDQQ